MTTDDRPGSVRAADTAAEAIRALNHATIRPGDIDGYRSPSDVDAVIAHLETLAMRLPQAFEQAMAWLHRENRSGRIGHDEQTDPGPAVWDTLAALQAATEHARKLEVKLRRAHTQTSHLTGTGDTE